MIDREIEIESFKSKEYWTIETSAIGSAEKSFKARLSNLEGKKLSKFDINNEKDAKNAAEIIKNGSFSAIKIDKKESKRNPTPPFTTSTLQQEAARKLGFSTTRTMRTAQYLYEGIDLGEGERTGIITYMRTDSVNLASEAIDATRIFVKDTFGDLYIPEKPRLYKGKSKNSQEAHEAIRPTDSSRQPDEIKRFLDADQFKLYKLIWKRMVACQMSTAVFDQVAVDIGSDDKKAILRANGSTLKFDGFLKVYKEGKDDEPEENDENTLPKIEEGESIKISEIYPNQHFTAPPPRYTEASMVKKMEELGIGRPSTYSSILKTLQDRDYVILDKKRFFPKDRGRIVVAFLLNYFHKYVEYGFTAEMEERLDEVSNGDINWKGLMNDFWSNFNNSIDQTKDLTITEVIEKLDDDLDSMLFPSEEDEKDNKDLRKCIKCNDGRLGLKLGRYGAFIGCSNYPECQHTRKLSPLSEESNDSEGKEDSPAQFETKELGEDPKTGDVITFRKGPYGFYFQWGEAVKGSKKKPKRVSLPKDKKVEDVNLEMALSLTAFPKELGEHPETGDEVSVGVGRYGPYIKYQNKYTSVKGEDILIMSLDQAVEFLKQKKK